LGLYDADLSGEIPKELLIENYPLLVEHLKNDKPVKLGVDISKGFLSPSFPPLKLETLVKRLKQVYSHHIGTEFSHLETKEQKNWICEKLETLERFKFSNEKKKVILDRLCYADTFERFLAMKFPAAKRFGLEGCESLIPGLKEVIDQSALNGVETVVIGMPHRGRLNVLQSVLRKPTSDIIREFKGAINDTNGSGDVKYHMGMSITRELVQVNKKVHLSLAPNPSHLEAVNPGK
jgi:2-oxoglutarate dehydrogenase E1 component